MLPLPRGEGRLLLQRAEAGICARRRTHFSCLAKKSKQKKATQLFASPSGQPASVRLRGAPWNSLRAARCTRTTTASQFTKHACPAARMPPRKHPATGATRWEFVSGLCFARPPRTGAQRHVWHGPSAATARDHPFCVRLGRAGRGVAGVPQDTPASTSGLPQLFERSAQRAASSAAHRANEHPRLPRSAA